ncbi:MAG: PepSY-associated TM helix domain-containing protein [Pseudomonadota bacterium]
MAGAEATSARVTAAQPKKKAKKKSNRKQLYALHSWLGFHLALIMAVVLFTGTMATVSHEIDWLMQHDMRVIPDGEKVSWGTMQAAVEAYAPGETITTLSAMEGDHFAYRARVVDAYGRQTFVHVNQWTGEVTGETHPLTVQRVFRDLHRYLFMPNYIGLPLVTSLGFVLAISLYTGLKTTRNWKTLLFRVRTDKGARIMWGDAHKAAGLWGIWFFAVIIVTGIWYLVEYGVAINAKMTDSDIFGSRPRLSAERVVEMGPVINDRGLDEVVAAAKAAYPQLRVTNIILPSYDTAPFAVQGMVGNPLARERSNTVYLDPESLEVLKVLRWRDSNTFVQLNEMADPLHFGFFGGLPTKLIWFVFGVFMTGLSITGVWLTWKRLKSTAISKSQFATMPVLFASMVFCAQWYDRFQGPDVPDGELLLAKKDLGEGLVAKMHLGLDEAERPTGLVRMTIESAAGRSSVSGLSFYADDGETIRKRPSVRGRTVEARFNLDDVCGLGAARLDFGVDFAGDEGPVRHELAPDLLPFCGFATARSGS